jgi:hypothetical protein
MPPSSQAVRRSGHIGPRRNRAEAHLLNAVEPGRFQIARAVVDPPCGQQKGRPNRLCENSNGRSAAAMTSLIRFKIEWASGLGHFADRIPKSMEKCLGFSWSGTIPTSGKDRKIEMPPHRGVLIIGHSPHDIPHKANKGPAASVRARKWKAAWRMIHETEH